MAKEQLYRCNKAYTLKCPDKHRKHGCGARIPHNRQACGANTSGYSCMLDGGFMCKCVKYVRPKAVK